MIAPNIPTTPMLSGPGRGPATDALDLVIVVHNVHLDLWKIIFRFQHDGELPVEESAFTLEYVQRRLSSSLDGQGVLADAVQAILELGNEHGQDAIHRAAPGIPDYRYLPNADDGEAEEAARLWIAARRSPPDQEGPRIHLERARALADRRPSKKYRRFCCTQTTDVDINAIPIREVERDFRTWFNAHGQGGTVQVRIAPNGAEIILQVVHGARTKVTQRMTLEGMERLVFVPATCDVLRFQPRVGQLLIAAARPTLELLAMYRLQLGQLFFGDPLAFTAEPAVTLHPLQEGPAALEPHVRNIHSARLVQVVWRKPNGAQYQISSTDCYREFADSPLRYREGEFQRAVLEIKLYQSEARMHTVRVTIAPPGTVQFNRDHNEPEIEAYLTDLGIYEVDQAQTVSTLWDLGSRPHPATKWVDLIRHQRGSTGVPDLVHEGILVACEPTLVPHPLVRSLSLPLQRLDDQTKALIPDDSTIPLHVPTSTEAEAFRLDLEAAHGRLTHRLGLDNGDAPSAAAGFVYLGERACGHRRLAVFLMHRDPDGHVDLVLDQVRARAGGATVVLLIPRGVDPKVFPGQHCIRWRLDDIAAAGQDLLEQVLRSGQLLSEVDAIEWAHGRSELILQRGRRKCWSQGRLVELNERSLDALLFIANAAKPPTADELQAHLGSGSTGRRVVLETRRAFTSVGLPDPIVTAPGGGYALSPTPFIAE